MSRFLTVAFALICFPSLADIFLPAAEQFHPTATVVWAVTNRLPSSMEIYETVQTNFSALALSNAMAMGAFKPIDIKSQTRDTLIFEARKDNVLTRCLKMSQTGGWIDYFKSITDYSSIRKVPSSNETKRLALDYLRRFGGDTNQVSAMIRRTEQTVDSYDRRGGKLTNEAVSVRGIILTRQINGIASSDSFLIEFGNDATVTMLKMNWRILKPIRHVQMPSKHAFIDKIKAGQTVVLPDINGGDIPAHAGSITITKASPIYRLLGVGKFVCPSVDFEIIADMGTTNATSFVIEDPVQEAP